MRIYAPSRMQSAKDAPSQLQMKYRQLGQGSKGEVQDKDLLAELEEKERKHLLKKTMDNFEEERLHDLKLLEAGGDAGAGGVGLAKTKQLVPKALDADDDDGDDSSDEDDSDDDDDEDDEAELLAELERIKRERADEAARKAAEEAAEVEAQKREELVRGNPLLELGGDGAGGSFQVKRRWDDDVVFKNQARGEPKAQRRFINDTIRSDFHRRFLNRYIK